MTLDLALTLTTDPSRKPAPNPSPDPDPNPNPHGCGVLHTGGAVATQAEPHLALQGEVDRV